ncbi:MAG: iron-containing alcohol dehydrogenase, partial [Sphaerochaetaceae bacterium]|nr:iron-containing alcohol dehydrogenase [Sphaerochaetaceae bacterium]
MNNFSWQCPTKLILGKDTIDQVASEIKALGCSRVLMVYGSGSIKRNGIYDKTAKSLNDAGLYFKELSGVEPNPHYDLVLKGVELVKANDLDFILAVGGGSVIDTAKAISAGALVDSLDTFFEDCFLGGKPVTAVMKKGAILTIPAAGSEMSNSCVITNTKTGFKRGINTFLNYPQFAILDPTACYSLPAYQTACGCADILAHMQERYFSNTTDTYFSDLVLEASMKAIIELGPRCMDNPTDYDLRAQIMFIGSMAHNNLLGACRTQDWASHWLEHELSTQYNVAHGAGLAIIFPAWMRYVHKANPR